MKYWKAFVLLVLFISLASCANQTFTVKPDLVANFKPIATPTDSETYVYVIRGSQFKGGGRDINVGVNDVLLAELSNASHTFLKLRSGINTISLVQSGRAFAYKTIDNRAGEIVFIYLDYEVGTLSEARSELGKSMVQETKYEAAYSTSKSTSALTGVIMNPGWLGLDYMKADRAPLSPDDKHGVVTIARPGIEFKQAILDVWSDSEGLIGSLTGESVIQVKLPAGKHRISTYLHQLSTVELSITEGENYYIQLKLDRGYSGSKISMSIVPNDNISQKWVEKLELNSINSVEAGKPQVAERVSAGLAKLQSLQGEI